MSSDLPQRTSAGVDRAGSPPSIEPDSPSLTIRNATLRHGEGLHQIRIDSGRVTGIVPEGDTQLDGETEIDAECGLVTEAFVNGHLHLCKVYTLDQLGDAALKDYHAAGMGGAMSAIEAAAAIKKDYRAERVAENAARAVERAIVYGTGYIRAFADTDTSARLEGVKGVMAVRDRYRDSIRIDVVAFPQDGLIRDPGAEQLVREALKLGADVVGGIPWIEFTDADAHAHVERMCELAREYDRDISMLVDDAGDAGLRTLELLATKVAEIGWQGRVTAQHARAMQLYAEPYFRKLCALLQRAGIGVVSDPHTGPLHARVRDLLAAGIPVALGQDDVFDAYYPFGRNNMLEVAFLAAHLLWMTSPQEIETLYDMITVHAARVVGLDEYGLRPGGRADLVIHTVSRVDHALAEHAPPRVVLHGGRVVAHDGSLVLAEAQR